MRKATTLLVLFCLLHAVVGDESVFHSVSGTDNLYAASWHPAFLDSNNGDVPLPVGGEEPQNFQSFASVNFTAVEVEEETQKRNQQLGTPIYYCSQVLATACNNGEKQVIESFDFDDEFNTTELTLLGDASLFLGGVNLTPPQAVQVGGLFLASKVSISHFQSSFAFEILNQGTNDPDPNGEHGADGVGLVIANTQAPTLGLTGNNGGYAGTVSLAIFVDTYQNDGDPSNAFITVQSGGTQPNGAGSEYSLGYANITIEKGINTVLVSYNGPSETLTITFSSIGNEDVTFSVNVNIETLLGITDGQAWVGLTAATGDSYENHDIHAWSWTSFEKELICPCNPQADNDELCGCLFSDASGSQTNYYRGNLYQSLVGVWSSSSSSIVRIGSGLAFQLFDAEGNSNEVEIPFNSQQPVYLFIGFNDDVFTDNSGSLDIEIGLIEPVAEDDASTLEETADAQASIFLIVKQTFVPGGSKRQSDTILLLQQTQIEFNGTTSTNVTVSVYSGTNTTAPPLTTTTAPVIPPAGQPLTTTTFPFSPPAPLTAGTTYTLVATAPLVTSITSTSTSTSTSGSAPPQKRDSHEPDIKVSMLKNNKYPLGQATVGDQPLPDEDIKFKIKVFERKLNAGPQGIPCSQTYQCYEQGAILNFNYGQCLSGICLCSINSFFAGQATVNNPCRCVAPNRVEYYNNIAYCIRPHQCLGQQHWMCGPVSNDYNFVSCTQGVDPSFLDDCKCKPGFQGNATPNNKCRCEGTIVWNNGQPNCVV